MVREFLLRQSDGTIGLRARAERAQRLAATVAAAVTGGQHAYSQLIVNEFDFVCHGDLSYVAHEYLTTHNRSYWRSDFMALAATHGLAYVADADFNYPSGRLPEGLLDRVAEYGNGIGHGDRDDLIDLLCHRQLHSPILTPAPFIPRSIGVSDWETLRVASCLEPIDRGPAINPMFLHPTGYEVEAKSAVMADALRTLQGMWPRSLAITELFDDVEPICDDIRLLHRNGLIELRPHGCDRHDVSSEALTRFEQARGYIAVRHHARDLTTTGYESCGR